MAIFIAILLFPQDCTDADPCSEIPTIRSVTKFVRIYACSEIQCNLSPSFTVNQNVTQKNVFTHLHACPDF